MFSFYFLGAMFLCPMLCAAVFPSPEHYNASDNDMSPALIPNERLACRHSPMDSFPQSCNLSSQNTDSVQVVDDSEEESADV